MSAASTPSRSRSRSPAAATRPCAEAGSAPPHGVAPPREERTELFRGTDFLNAPITALATGTPVHLLRNNGAWAEGRIVHVGSLVTIFYMTEEGDRFKQIPRCQAADFIRPRAERSRTDTYVLGEKVSVNRSNGGWTTGSIIELTDDAVWVLIPPRSVKKVFRHEAERFIVRESSRPRADRSGAEWSFGARPCAARDYGPIQWHLALRRYGFETNGLVQHGPIQYHLAPQPATCVHDIIVHAENVVDFRPFLHETYYIGATTRGPEIRWFLDTGAPHHVVYKCMLVVWEGTGDEGRLVETALIDHFAFGRGDRLARNTRGGGGGISREAPKCWVYVCAGGGPRGGDL